MTTIALWNHSRHVSPATLQKWARALQLQISRDFAPIWQVPALLTVVPSGGSPAPGTWWLNLVDTRAHGDWLGLHDLTRDGLPMATVWVEADLQAGVAVSVTVSHELLELLHNPLLTKEAEGTYQGKPALFLEEVCDPPEDDRFSYAVQGVRVSDFCLPAYFTGGPGPYTFRGSIKKPVPALARGGYQSYRRPGDYDYRSIQAREHRGRAGSRGDLRSRPRGKWRRSTVNPLSS